MCTLSTFLVQGRLVKDIRQVTLVDWPYPSATDTTSTDLDILYLLISRMLFRAIAALSGEMNIPKGNTGYELNSQIDVTGRYVPIVDLTHDDDEDTNSHMSDIPLQLPTSANDPLNNSALIVTMRSDGSVLVIVHVHFEPDLVLGDLRERLHRISFRWPRYPEALGVIVGDLNTCEPEESRFNVRNQTFTESDAGKTAVFVPFSCSKNRANTLYKEGYRR